MTQSISINITVTWHSDATLVASIKIPFSWTILRLLFYSPTDRKQYYVFPKRCCECTCRQAPQSFRKKGKNMEKEDVKFSRVLWYPDFPSVAPSHVYFQLGCQSRSLWVCRLSWHHRAVIARELYVRLHVHLLAWVNRSFFSHPWQLTRMLEVRRRVGGSIIKQKACANLFRTVSDGEVGPLILRLSVNSAIILVHQPDQESLSQSDSCVLHKTEILQKILLMETLACQIWLEDFNALIVI